MFLPKPMRAIIPPYAPCEGRARGGGRAGDNGVGDNYRLFQNLSRIVFPGKGGYAGVLTKTFTVKQAANKITLNPAKTIAKKVLEAKTLKKKAITVALPKVSAKFGKAQWKVVAKDKKKVLSLSGSKIKVKKGAKKGAYTIKLKASVAKTKYYKAAATKVVTVKVAVK